MSFILQARPLDTLVAQNVRLNSRSHLSFVRDYPSLCPYMAKLGDVLLRWFPIATWFVYPSARQNFWLRARTSCSLSINEPKLTCQIKTNDDVSAQPIVSYKCQLLLQQSCLWRVCSYHILASTTRIQHTPHNS